MRKGLIERASGRRICLAFSLMAMISLLPAYNVVASVDEGLFEGVKVILAPLTEDSSMHQDGTVAAGEYDQNGTYKVPDTQLTVMLMHDNASLFVAISGPTWGWLALGISSDMEAGMGFVVVGSVGGTYVAEERFATNVNETIVLSAPHPPSVTTIDEFHWSQQGANVVAELKLSLDSLLWTLSTGVVYATVIATNTTVGYSLPGTASGDQIHYLGSYLFRSQDDPHVIKLLFSGEVSSIPGYVALALIALGTIAIVYEYMFRRGKR